MSEESKTKKILLIDGNTKDFPAFLQMMAQVESERETRDPLELLYTDNLSAGLKQVAKGGISLVLIGHPLPQGDEESVKILKKMAPALPVVAISAAKHKKLAEGAMKHGAQGYLLKGKNGSEDLGRLIDQL